MAVIIGLLLVINNQIRSIYDLWQKKDLVFNAQKELEYLKEENKKLEGELSYAQTDEFVEQTARDKLLWIKEGEQQVLFPEEIIQQDRLKNQTLKEERPNWQQWWEMFF